MNLYLRLIFTLLRAWRLPRFQVGTTLECTFRVLPNDIDINSHMNNGRYMTMVDLMLMEYFVRIGFAGVLIKQGWKPMSGGSFITYRRGLKPFQKYRLRYKIDACDEFRSFMRWLTTNFAAFNMKVLLNAVPKEVVPWLSAKTRVMETA
jgi:Thioesterase-like superfamily